MKCGDAEYAILICLPLRLASSVTDSEGALHVRKPTGIGMESIMTSKGYAGRSCRGDSD